MIEYHYLTDFQLKDEARYTRWIQEVLKSENVDNQRINYIFCSDLYLLELNQKYLQHDTLTDILTFDYTVDTIITGDVYISIERIRENAKTYETTLELELLRVMSHGLLHLIGFGDNSDDEIHIMRKKEEEKINMFHVEQ